MDAFSAYLGWLAGLIMATAIVITMFLWLGPVEVDCAEDDAWIAVDHHATDAVEDQHGVSRACRNVDQMLDSAVEVYIQNLP